MRKMTLTHLIRRVIVIRRVEIEYSLRASLMKIPIPFLVGITFSALLFVVMRLADIPATWENWGWFLLGLAVVVAVVGSLNWIVSQRQIEKSKREGGLEQLPERAKNFPCHLQR
jgi:hypothetical protein